MQLELRHPAKKLSCAALLVLTVSYLALVTLHYLAAYFSAFPDEAHLRRAAWLDPVNAQYRYQVGEYELLQKQSPQNAEAWLAAATSLNPHRAQYWLDLAIALQSVGNIEQEQWALQHALAANPKTPDIAWEAANLYLTQGSLALAMNEFHVVMENDPSLTSRAIQTCWKVRPDIDFLLADVVPANVYVPFLDFLISKNETQAAARVWEKIVAGQHNLDRGHLFEYVRYLIAHHEVSQSSLVWQQAASLSDLAAYQASSQNTIVNGDFSLDILNGGFDWLHQKTFGVTLALDPNETHSSPRSLRITFDGPGIEDAGLRQVIPVEPNSTYELSGFYKAEEMDGAGGARFVIQDLYRETPLYTSEDLRDADFWKKTGGTFTTGPDTRLIVLRIARVPAGSPIRGKLWIDGLKLVPGEHLQAFSMQESQ
jgi:hypothetical protein